MQYIQLFAEISAIARALTCKTRHAPSREEHPERWPSGLRRTLGKRVCGKPYRGFESHSLRHPVGLLEVGFEPGPAVGHQREQRRLRLDLLAELNPQIDDDASPWRLDLRVGKVQRRAIAQRQLRLDVTNVGIKWERCITRWRC
jgi:hypothetical protein